MTYAVAILIPKAKLALVIAYVASLAGFSETVACCKRQCPEFMKAISASATLHEWQRDSYAVAILIPQAKLVPLLALPAWLALLKLHLTDGEQYLREEVDRTSESLRNILKVDSYGPRLDMSLLPC